MSKRLFLYASVAALALAACNKSEVSTPDVTKEVQKGDMALNFGAYLGRGVTTKSGFSGELTTDELKTTGFGVFAYYTDAEMYSQMAKPNFMYNQFVDFDNSLNVWKYSPVRYWPNEFGSGAASEDVDRLSFFAYAPYTLVTPATGVVADEGVGEFDDQCGIIGMSRNLTNGDPYVKYVASFNPSKKVDLCWGVAKNNFTSTVPNATLTNDIAAGEPYIDVIKPAESGDESKINFDFKHALAALNVQIDCDADVTSHDLSDIWDDNDGLTKNDGFTRIYVREASFQGFALEGALNLNSVAPTPKWSDLNFSSILSTEPVTVYDGRRNGKEGVPTASARDEKLAELNPELIQSDVYTTVLGGAADQFQYTSFDSATPGVIPSAFQNLFNVSGIAPADQLTEPIYVIPTTEELTISLTYGVETADATLPEYLHDGLTKGTSIQNSITRGLGLTLEAGKVYTVKIHIGLTSVKFDASVTEWDDTPADTEDWYPNN